MNNWTILCDFDGTISVEDVIDVLLDRFGHPDWHTLEEDWVAGRIGSRACMTGQVGLLDMSRRALDAQLDKLWIDHAFADFVALTHRLGVPMTVVSDGLDYAIERLLRRHQLGDLPLMANHLRQTAQKTWQLETPFQADGCESGMCKCAAALKARASNQKILLIGDGASDFCVAGKVDFVFAKNRLIEHCRSVGIEYMPITGFEDAIHYLPQLLDGNLHNKSSTTASIAPTPH